MKKKATDGFGVGQCSLCEQYALTFGQQRHGGVRYCRECFAHTLAYVQLPEAQRTRFMNIWRGTEHDPRIIELLEQARGIPDDVRKGQSIGESRYRLMMAERDE